MDRRPVVVVTGASRRAGIGAAVARRLGADGWDVGLSCWRPYDQMMPWGGRLHDVDELVSELEATGARTVLIEGDLGDVAVPAKIFDDTEAALGPVTALIVVHAHDTGGGLLELTAKDVDRHLAVNARATLLLLAEFARRFAGPAGRGRIVTFTSGLPLKGLDWLRGEQGRN